MCFINTEEKTVSDKETVRSVFYRNKAAM